jgi:hypothetical protein
MAINMCGKNCSCDKPVPEQFAMPSKTTPSKVMAKKKLKVFEYKRYYHNLFASTDGLICFGSNLPEHPEGSCVNPNHPLAANVHSIRDVYAPANSAKMPVIIHRVK